VKLPRDLSGQRFVHALKRLGFVEEGKKVHMSALFEVRFV